MAPPSETRDAAARMDAQHKMGSGGVEWVGGLVSLPTYVADGETPFRPEAIVWMVPGGGLLAMEAGRPGEVRDRAEATFRAASEKPLFGAPHLPSRVRVESKELAELLKRVVDPSIDVVCAKTPELDAFLRTMREKMAERSFGTPSFLSETKKAADVSRFFRATAALYRKAPWRIVPDDTKLMTVTIPSLAIEDAAVSVIGQSGKRFGAIIFSSIRDFEACLDGAEAFGRGEEPDMPPHLALNFDRGDSLRAEIQAEIRAHGWEVADAESTPWLVAVDRQLIARAPTAREVLIVEVVALALTHVLGEPTPLLAGWSEGGSFARTLLVGDTGAMREVTVRTA